MTIAVIGGTGGMGKTLIRFFRSHKISVSAVGRATSKPLLYLEKADVIVLSLPSRALPYAISLLSQIDLSKKLIVSLGSIMTYDKKALTEAKLPKATILYFHQLFGPKTYPFTGQRVVIAGATEHSYSKALIRLFKKDKVVVTMLSQEDHDRIMASVQALSQFSVITLAKTLSESGNTANNMNNVASVTYKMGTDLIKRVMSQKADLWAFLQFENPYAIKALEKHSKNVQFMLKMAKNKDYKKFEQVFNKTSEFWK